MHLTHLITTVKHRCVKCGAETGSASENDTCELALTPGDLQDASMGYVSSRLSMYVMCEHAGCHVDDKFSIRIELPDVELTGRGSRIRADARRDGLHKVHKRR